MRTVILLIASNLFMTVAWYGHLKYKQSSLWKVILASWFIAFFEYCLQVPANRWGHERFTTAQLKILQEAITLMVFTGFAVLYMHETFRWNYLVSYILIMAAVAFAFCPPEFKIEWPLSTRARTYAMPPRATMPNGPIRTR